MKLVKSQITNPKYQTNHNDQNSKSQTVYVLKNEIFVIYNKLLFNHENTKF
jgi:hypothetical protein